MGAGNEAYMKENGRLYLNTDRAYKDFRMLSGDKYFVDKSAMIEKVSVHDGGAAD